MNDELENIMRTFANIVYKTGFLDGKEEVLNCLRDLDNKQTLDEMGHWIEVGSLSCRCDKCMCKNDKQTKFCPNCGIRMLKNEEVR